MKGGCIWCRSINLRILLRILCLSHGREKKKHERESGRGEFHRYASLGWIIYCGLSRALILLTSKNVTYEWHYPVLKSLLHDLAYRVIYLPWLGVRPSRRAHDFNASGTLASWPAP